MDVFAAEFHQPFWSRGGSTDTDTVYVVAKPFGTDVLRAIHTVCGRIYAATGFAEYVAITAFLSTNENDDVMPCGKSAYVGQAVGYLSADCVEVAEFGFRTDTRINVVNYLSESLQRFCRLAEQADVAAEIQHVGFLGILDDDSGAIGLSDQSQDFGMSRFAIYDDLGIARFGVYLLDAALQLQNDRAGGIYDVDTPFLSEGVCTGWLAMGTQ